MTIEPISAPSIAGAGSMPTTGRWGWYKDHQGNEYRRVSTLVKKVETDTYHLDLWKQRQVAEGLAIRDDLVLALKAMGRPPAEGWTRDQKKEINRIVESASEAAKSRDGAKVGTAMHTLTERLDRGEPLERVAAGLPAEAGQGIRSYAAMRELNGWRTIEIERTVICDELEVAGTFDRIDLVPGLAALLGPGDCQYGHEAAGLPHDPSGVNGSDELPVIDDVKTEGEPWRNGLHIGPQLAIYSRARRMWRPTGGGGGEYVPMPCVRQDVAIVTHLNGGHARPYFVNLVEGWEAAVAAYEQMNREARAGRRLGAAGAWFVPVPNIAEPKAAQTFVEHAAAARYADPNRPEAVPVGASTFSVDGTTIASATPMSDGTTHYAVGDVVTVGGIDFVKHAEYSTGDLGGLCPNCAPIIMGASVDRVDGTDPRTPCATCANITPEGIARAPRPGERVTVSGAPVPSLNGEQVAVRDEATGLVSWRPAPAAEHVPATLDEKSAKLIEQIWRSMTVDALAVLWKMAQDRGVLWAGPIAMAGDARRRQIECPQRALHTGNGKCACGWITGVPA